MKEKFLLIYTNYDCEVQRLSHKIISKLFRLLKSHHQNLHPKLNVNNVCFHLNRHENSIPYVIVISLCHTIFHNRSYKIRSGSHWTSRDRNPSPLLLKNSSYHYANLTRNQNPVPSIRVFNHVINMRLSMEVLVYAVILRHELP